MGFSDYRSGLRVAGPTAHPIAFSAILSMTLVLSMARSLEAEARRTRLLSAACSALIGLAVFLSLSRTGIIGVTVGGLVFMLGLPRHRLLLLSTALAMVGFVHVAFGGVVGTLIEYLSPSYVLSQETGNKLGRLADYRAGLPDILNRPLFGRGFNTYGPDRYVLKWIDNQYLKFALEIGVVGVAAFLFLMWRAISVPFMLGRRMGGETGAVLIAMAGSAAVFAVTSATFDTVGFPQVAYLFFSLSGLGAVIVNEHGRAR
jgi:O-antigen ligase